jgi:glyoxylase-like metal-dependent hydrolase (beta-lactamase superfamily II)
LIVGVVLLWLGLLSGGAVALEKDYPVDAVADGVYVIHGPLETPNEGNQGFMNNPAFVITSEGVVVIDPGSSVQVGQMVLAKIRTVTDLPVVAVFNTHVHGDHWLGNQAVRAAYPDAGLYGHPRMLERVGAGEGTQWVEMMDRLTGGATRGTVVVGPDTPIGDGDSITIGDSRFDILHTGKAHTDTDIMIHAVKQDVLFLGDNVAYKRILRLDDGSFKGNIEAIDTALALGAGRLVPGHGRTGGPEVANAYRAYLEMLRSEVKTHYEDGLSDFEIKPLVEPKLVQWKSWAGFEEELGKHVSLNYLEIESEDF